MEDMKITVLFLCTHNSARSQMAEAFLNQMGSDRFEAYSAGLEPKDINPYTKRVMSEIGIDISSQYPKVLKDFMGRKHFGYLITVCTQAEERCPSTFPGIGKRLFWDIKDPDSLVGSEEEKLSKFREIRDQIRHKIEQWLSGQTG